jgi:prepilin-type N-terminal cleavage/methylation domain-containing protein
MVFLMRNAPHAPRVTADVRGFTLVEALAALGIFSIAVLVATAFLQAHVQAARRLEVRSALVHATETTLEEIRGGLRPMVSAKLDRGTEFGLAPGAVLLTSIQVDGGGVVDLYHVVVTSRSAAAGRPMEVAVETMVWRP